jgi:hypothetical protein
MYASTLSGQGETVSDLGNRIKVLTQGVGLTPIHVTWNQEVTLASGQAIAVISSSCKEVENKVRGKITFSRTMPPAGDLHA